MPKFTIESTFNLKKLLESMGMTKAFTTEADFSGIAGPPGYLFIGKGMQKTFVDVKEEGTEAAAVTHVEVEKKSEAKRDPPPPKVFRADHPFLFLLRDRKHNTVLFMGRMLDPSLEPRNSCQVGGKPFLGQAGQFFGSVGGTGYNPEALVVSLETLEETFVRAADEQRGRRHTHQGEVGHVRKSVIGNHDAVPRVPVFLAAATSAAAAP